MMAVKSDAKNEEAPRDPVRRWTLIILGLIVILFFYSIVADRLTPYTSQATVQAFVVRMAPEVAGRVSEPLAVCLVFKLRSEKLKRRTIHFQRRTEAGDHRAGLD